MHSEISWETRQVPCSAAGRTRAPTPWLYPRLRVVTRARSRAISPRRPDDVCKSHRFVGCCPVTRIASLCVILLQVAGDIQQAVDRHSARVVRAEVERRPSSSHEPCPPQSRAVGPPSLPQSARNHALDVQLLQNGYLFDIIEYNVRHRKNPMSMSRKSSEDARATTLFLRQAHSEVWDSHIR